MNFDKLSTTEQRNLTKNYLEAKKKEMKVKFQSQTEIAVRFGELMKFIKGTEVQLNVDSLTGQKIDTKVIGIIFNFEQGRDNGRQNQTRRAR